MVWRPSFRISFFGALPFFHLCYRSVRFSEGVFYTQPYSWSFHKKTLDIQPYILKLMVIFVFFGGNVDNARFFRYVFLSHDSIIDAQPPARLLTLLDPLSLTCRMQLCISHCSLVRCMGCPCRSWKGMCFTKNLRRRAAGKYLEMGLQDAKKMLLKALSCGWTKRISSFVMVTLLFSEPKGYFKQTCRLCPASSAPSDAPAAGPTEPSHAPAGQSSNAPATAPSNRDLDPPSHRWDPKKWALLGQSCNCQRQSHRRHPMFCVVVGVARRFRCWMGWQQRDHCSEMR